MDPDAVDCQTAMYCNHYPSWERKAYKEGTLRRIAHTDFEVLTLLFQRQGTSFHYAMVPALPALHVLASLPCSAASLASGMTGPASCTTFLSNKRLCTLLVGVWQN